MTVLPLQGFRAVNFGWYWAGPQAGQALADMGAELITIESRKRLNAARWSNPFFMNKRDDVDYNLWGHNIYRSAHNIGLDMAHPEGRELFKGIIRVTDVLIVNFAAGVMEKLGLGWDDLRRVNPTLIMVYLSTAGLSGPLKDIQLFGSVIGSIAGIDAVQGYEGGQPMSQGASVPDPLNGMMGAFAALAALRLRQRTGQGKLVDFSQLEALTSITGGPLMDWWLNKRLSGPLGNRNPKMAPHGVYPSKGQDQWVSIAVASDPEWHRFCEVLGNPEWTKDERFSTLPGRLKHQDDLDRHIAAWTCQRTNYEATHALQARHVAAFPALSCKELFEDPHFEARGNWVEVDHALGHETISGSPWKLSDTPPRLKPNHIIGADNHHVYCDIVGLSEKDFERLSQDGALT